MTDIFSSSISTAGSSEMPENHLPNGAVPIVRPKWKNIFAELLESEEFQRKFRALLVLKTPLDEETPPWEDDPVLAASFDEDTAEMKRMQVERAQAREDTERLLKEAQAEYDNFIYQPETVHCPVEGMSKNSGDPARSKDDMHAAKRKSSILKRRPSFMADTSHTSIDTPSKREEGGRDELLNPTRNHLLLSSTPNVRYRAFSVDNSEVFMDDPTQRPSRQSRVSVHFEEPLRREATFERGDLRGGSTKENKSPNDHNDRTTGPSGPQEKTVLKAADTTKVVGSQPRIVPRPLAQPAKRAIPGRPTAASRPPPKTGATRLLPERAQALPSSRAPNAAKPAKTLKPPSAVVRPGAKVAVRPAVCKK